MTTALVAADRAYALHEEAVTLAASISLGFMRLAEVLKEIRDGRHYETLNYESFAQYCNAPDHGLSYRQAARLISVYESYRPLVEQGVVTTDELAQIGSTKLDVARKEIIEAVDPSELLAAARTLSVNDLKLRLREDNGEVVDEHLDYLVRRVHRYAYDLAEHPQETAAILDELASFCMDQREKLA
jgi:hypothetical protein